ncbi:MAG TPA: hemolysin family protein [Fimbriimonadaceae bacterium]|nr:hemolysin family protein [Fimbriimonadaceae bacterium]
MGDTWLMVLISLLLLLGSIFFVAAEYAMVSSRKSRIEALARRGSKPAKALAKQLDDISPYVAGSQVGITMISIGVGSLTEPFMSGLVIRQFGDRLSRTGLEILHALTFLLLTFMLVVLGELVPKYISLQMPERVAIILFRPLQALIVILRPIIWLAQSSAKGVVRLFGIDATTVGKDNVAKEELVMLVQSGGAEGTLDKMHAEMVSRALKLDSLDARDIMIHRLDIKWLDAAWSKETLLQRLKNVPFTRLPVCRGDIDDMVGIAYLHDIVKSLDDPAFSLEKIARPLIAVPENLTLEKIVASMRDNKTQMLIVMDEYGGTSGLITLEDVVEEVFGELEDRLESERPPVEISNGGRISARSEVRLDELITQLNLPIDTTDKTDTLATLIVRALGRVPRPGDSIESEIGILRVENMARRRITRVSVQILPKLMAGEAEEE